MKFFNGKKAEKELQMIFGLFILLIISLVVLNLFFKFTEKSSGKMEGASTAYFTKEQKSQVIQDCEMKCDGIIDDNSRIEFCKATKKIDWNGDQTLGGKIREGKWEFCEDMIPCFVLVDNCKEGTYTGASCMQILSNPEFNNLDTLAALSAGKASDVCNLTSTGADLTTKTCADTANANWRCKFGFFSEV
ncbi:MAG: hypothetical protein NTV63_03420 [Candidatus Woesearchaeota archaeon]|nr:hypothetical protein [Candidatus Woesearchaeota archaeon]